MGTERHIRPNSALASGHTGLAAKRAWRAALHDPLTVVAYWSFDNLWLTCASDPCNVADAGVRGMNLLTVQLFQPSRGPCPAYPAYRQARTEAELDPDSGAVT